MVAIDKEMGHRGKWVRVSNRKAAGYDCLNQNPPFMGFPTAADVEDRRRQNVALLPPRLSSALLAGGFTPLVDSTL
jgi:hypothetical protein